MHPFFTAVLFLVVAAGLAIPWPLQGPAAAAGKAPAFVSSATCGQCHEGEAKAWSTSHHAWALKHADTDSMLGDFDDASFTHNGVTSKFFKRDGKFFVETDGPDGKLTEYQVLYAVGVEPLQQYLVELPGGRLQALDTAWDTSQKRWFHLYPTQDLKGGDGLHWTGPYKNWNARCAECHQTNFVKGYDASKKTYQSKWSELTVTCQACHGPGEAHVKWAENPETYKADLWPGTNDKGLTVAFTAEKAQTEIQLCAACHSRRSALGADSPPPGAPFHDHYRLALLRNGLYFADGQINEEVYVYGSFLQSKMHQKGVRCSNCHEVHSATLRAEGNAVCTQCHSPAGNPDFPSLTKAEYDAPSHHHHKEGTEAALCVSCHMPSRTYMQVDPRRDHSFRVPRPDLSVKLKTPNACTACHDDKSAQWAAAAQKSWYPAGRIGKPHHAEVIHAAWRGASPQIAMRLAELARDKAKPAIVRATALDLLRSAISPQALKSIVPLFKDDSSLVRAAALRVLEQTPASIRASVGSSLLKDPARTVRLEATRLFLGIPQSRLAPPDQLAVSAAMKDYLKSLDANADFPEIQMQIAGQAMVSRRFDIAEKAFEDAVAMDPQLAQAWLTLARLQLARGKDPLARKTLEAAKEKLPGNGEVFLQLGALRSRQNDHKAAIAALMRSIELSGKTTAAMELLINSYMATGDIVKARDTAKDLMATHPGHRPSTVILQLLRE